MISLSPSQCLNRRQEESGDILTLTSNNCHGRAGRGSGISVRKPCAPTKSADQLVVVVHKTSVACCPRMDTLPRDFVTSVLHHLPLKKKYQLMTLSKSM